MDIFRRKQPQKVIFRPDPLQIAFDKLDAADARPSETRRIVGGDMQDLTAEQRVIQLEKTGDAVDDGGTVKHIRRVKQLFT